MRRVAIDGKRTSHNPAFDHALKKAAALVQAAAKQRHLSVAYELPEFVHGCPAFKVSACAEYVSNALSLRGFDVQMLGLKVLIISWDEKKQAADKHRVQEKQHSLHTCDIGQGFKGLTL
jgi:hypothetical protein